MLILYDDTCQNSIYQPLLPECPTRTLSLPKSRAFGSDVLWYRGRLSYQSGLWHIGYTSPTCLRKTLAKAGEPRKSDEPMQATSVQAMKKPGTKKI